MSEFYELDITRVTHHTGSKKDIELLSSFSDMPETPVYTDVYAAWSSGGVDVELIVNIDAGKAWIKFID